MGPWHGAELTQRSDCVYREFASSDYPARLVGLDLRFTSRSYRSYCAPMVICCLDVHLPALTTHLELCLADICFLEVR